MLSHGELVGGCYTIREQLAETETGTVYEARDMMLDRAVALKLGRPDAQSLIIESRRIASVRDACAVAIHGMGSHQGVEYVVAERVTGALLRDAASQTAQLYLARLRTLTAALVRAHEAGIAIGDLSAASTIVDGNRIVFGRLSLSQIPPAPVFAPEVLRGEAAEDTIAIDLYGLGCVAIEMANGMSPFGGDPEAHMTAPPPRLADLRTDLPTDLSDLVEWLLAKQPALRPRSAAEVLAQLEAVIDRLGAGRARTTRVLIVDDDGFRARRWASLARRAHPAAIVETASEGADAAHKLNRDHPDLVLLDGELRGVMNAAELCRYARNLEIATQLVVIGAAAERDRALFGAVGAELLADDAELPFALLDRVRTAAADRPNRKKRPTLITG